MASLSEKIKKHQAVWKIDLLIIFVFIVIVMVFALWSPQWPSRLELNQLMEKFPIGKQTTQKDSELPQGNSEVQVPDEAFKV